MTDEQINAAIAEACGWTNVSGKAGRAPNADYVGSEFIPNYCNDLNAMHEAEEVLNQDNLYIMALHIEALCGRGEFYFRATARQRAEALLRTLGKWDDQSGKRTEMEVQK